MIGFLIIVYRDQRGQRDQCTSMLPGWCQKKTWQNNRHVLSYNKINTIVP